MSRPTRAETHERTRTQLIETAQRLFLKDGYAQTSLERVAAGAGYSKGAVYSNFANKQQLCLAVLDRIQQEQVTAVLAATAGATTAAEWLAGFGTWAEASIGDEAWTSLEVEFATAARHNPEIRAALARRRADVTDMLAAVLETMAPELGVKLPAPAEELVITALGLGIGLGVLRAVDPTVPISPLIDLLGSMAGIKPGD